MLKDNTDNQNPAAGGKVDASASLDSNANKNSIDNMERVLCTYIVQTLLPPDCDIELNSDDDLLSIEYLDSMQFMRLVPFTEETYALKIPPEDLLIENFQTVDRLAQYLTAHLSRS